VRDHFKVASLDGFGLKNKTAAVGAAEAALHYLTQHLRATSRISPRFRVIKPRNFLGLDITTLRHLEILEPLHRDAPRNANALRRAQPHHHAHGRSAPARLALTAARRRRRHPPPSGIRQTWMSNGETLEKFRAQLAQVRIWNAQSED